jgi:hypothetical protein
MQYIMLVLKSDYSSYKQEEQETIASIVDDYIKSYDKSFSFLDTKDVERALTRLLRNCSGIRVTSCVVNILDEYNHFSFIPETFKDNIKEPITEDGIKFDKSGLTIYRGHTFEEIAIFFIDNNDKSALDEMIFLVEIDPAIRKMSKIKIKKVASMSLSLSDQYRETRP